MKRILLVEDDAIIGMDKCRRITLLGYDCDVVRDGETAVRNVLDVHTPFDLILMDIDLGRGIDGTEAARRILESTSIPIVFMSSHTDEETIRKTEGITSYGYIVKSSNDIVLDVQIKMALRLFAAKRTADHERTNLERIFNSSPLGMMIVDDRYEVTRVNRMAERIVGTQLSSLHHRRCGNFLGCASLRQPPQICGETPLCADCGLFAGIKDALTGNEAGESEALFRVEPTPRNTPNQTILRRFRFSTSPIMLDGREAAIVTFADVTEGEKRNRRLRQFAELLESSNALVVITDSARTVTWVNSSFERLTGYGMDELVGKNPGELLQGPDPDMELRRRMTAAFDHAQQFETEITNFTRDGAQYRVHMDVRPLFDETGRHEGFISIQRTM